MLRVRQRPRFLGAQVGRRVELAAVVTLGTALRHGRETGHHLVADPRPADSRNIVVRNTVDAILELDARPSPSSPCFGSTSLSLNRVPMALMVLVEHEPTRCGICADALVHEAAMSAAPASVVELQAISDAPRLPQPHPRPLAILVDEDDAGSFEGRT